MRLPLSVHVFLVCRSRNADEMQYLLLQRVARPELALPDFWQGISGALENRETFEHAAIREVAEETGIAIARAMFSGFEQALPIKDEWRDAYGPEPTHVVEKVFYAFVSQQTQPALSAEHKSWRWCSYDDALALLTFGQNAACLQSVARAASQAA